MEMRFFNEDGEQIDPMTLTKEQLINYCQILVDTVAEERLAHKEEKGSLELKLQKRGTALYMALVPIAAIIVFYLLMFLIKGG